MGQTDGRTPVPFTLSLPQNVDSVIIAHTHTHTYTNKQ